MVRRQINQLVSDYNMIGGETKAVTIFTIREQIELKTIKKRICFERVFVFVKNLNLV